MYYLSAAIGWLTLSKNMIIAAFPQSAMKIIIQDDNETTEPVFCWQPELTEYIKKKLIGDKTISEIYIFGPKDYIKKIATDIQKITELPIIEEGI